MVLAVKNSSASAGDVGDMGSIPGSEDSLEKGMATPSSVLAWKIPRTEEPGRLQSIGVTKSRTRLSTSIHNDFQNDTLLFCINQSLSYVLENRENKILTF